MSSRQLYPHSDIEQRCPEIKALQQKSLTQRPAQSENCLLDCQLGSSRSVSSTSLRLPGTMSSHWQFDIDLIIQGLAICQWHLTYLAIFWILMPSLFYLVVTPLWPLPVLYIAWLILDWKTPEQGGRRSTWVRNWHVWTKIQNYFPIMLLKTKDLSPEHNYIMGVHPHGILTFGAFCNFCTEATGFSTIFPGITPHLATLSWFFKLPIIREYIMAKGVCPVSQSSINYLLSQRGSGNLVGIVIGGVGEALQSVPNSTSLIIRKHKGFVRTALQHGAHLVPTFTFGETEVYHQVLFPEGSRMNRFQCWFRSILGFYCCVFYGRGFFQDFWGLLPLPEPIITVVGEPVMVPKIENPSQETVDKYHTLYIEALQNLFDEYKTQYGASKTQELLFL
ncbi:acyl-CoA wax alcohol acyltransferase 1 [Notamacropus eugenii]|uniref:acyl-CoA wax alcohol acyltransferase 1 n=1 Tax=Notamacropus eugenii TaxID=9315 RepID=UPI003B677AB2